MKKFLAVAVSLIAPGMAFAQTLDQSVSTFPRIINQLTAAVNALIPLFLAIAVVYFIWGVIQYVLKSDPEGKAAARGYMIYGIIGIAVIVSLFGIVRLLQNTFNISGNQQITVPQVPQV